MNATSPHGAAEGSLNQDAAGAEQLSQVAGGQKMVIVAILINLGALILQSAVNPVFALLLVVSGVLSIIGVIRLAAGMGIQLVMRICIILLMFLPLISLLTLLVLNSKATRRLREGGYHVGLLGASRPD